MKEPDYYVYHIALLQRRRRRRIMIALAAVLVAVCAAVGFFHFGGFSQKAVPAAAQVSSQQLSATAVPAAASQAAAAADAAASAAEGTASPETPAEAAYLPQRLLPQVDTAAWDKTEAVDQTIDTDYLNTDYRMVALPAQGKIASEYFNTVTFVGDSLTQGLELYETGLPNAKYCAYKGAGPNTIVNNSSVTNEISKVTETPLEALEASAPDYVYILFGTNSLVSQNGADSFLAYYEKMIDIMRERLNPGVIYYIQAIPGVRADIAESKPGLNNDRIRAVNNQLANLALRKGCYFVNLQEALTNQDGTQIDDYGAKDGIHYKPSGYEAWSGYLATHTAWNRRSLYQGENPYYIFGA